MKFLRLLFFAVALGTATCGNKVEEVAAPQDQPATSSIRCWSDCQCQLGSYCLIAHGASEGNCAPWMWSFSRDVCFGSCQCDYPNYCAFSVGSGYNAGQCTPPTKYCSSDCSCGVSQVCSRLTRRCETTFGPFPQCRCAEHCPPNKSCVNGSCQ